MNLSAWRVKPQEYVSNDQKESPPLRLNLKKMVILSSNAYTQATAVPAARMQCSIVVSISLLLLTLSAII